ncbi:unknown [Clostridium sp. CAG:352]|nr:unknown [Clostridium sp. CAG:352]
MPSPSRYVIFLPVTVTVAVAVLPLEVVAVITAVPSATPITLPIDTVATDVLLDVQVTSLLVAFEGVTVAVRVVSFPSITVAVVGEIVIPVGFIIFGFSLTLTETVAVSPLEVFTVIVAVPTETPVIFPPATVATAGLLDVQVTILFVALSGVTFAVTFSELPSRIETEDLLTEIPVTGTTSIGSGAIGSAAPPSVR